MLGEVATDLPKSADSESDDSADDDFELLEGIANFAFACFPWLTINYLTLVVLSVTASIIQS